ncbi:MAG: ribulose-bisphosphate carboxylase large subunit [Patescibacteria group bacterium]|nr:ribulose-bisphosphate carboxylase large subunit [Patescibacteria group bacterium]MCL5095607.1 ribulose-bisphosphate carboxylase large subunit [Patescibacteria group bacterium]
MDNLEKTIEEIKSLKIQGATNVAKAGLKVLQTLPTEKIPEAIEALLLTRPTEPLLQNSLRLVQLKGKSVITPTLGRFDDIENEILTHGLPLIKEGMRILTHCHSSSVVNLLKEAAKKGLTFKVYLTETRPFFQGRITARELTEAGISTTMITDSEAAFLISKEDEKDLDLILLGADALSQKGGAFNKVGSYGIALSAFHAKIPLFIVTTLLKFSSQTPVIEERNGKEIWENKPQDLEIFNPSFDYVPPEFITGFLCEFGQVLPQKMKTMVRKNYPWIIEMSKTKTKTMKNFSPYKSYLHLEEKVDLKNHIVAHFLLGVDQKTDFGETAGGVAAESSIGTWTKITTEAQSSFERLHARVLEADKKTHFLKIAYPLELFEEGNLPQLLSSVAGNIFGLKEVKSLKLIDLNLPEKYVMTFPGPALGLLGIRKLTGISQRPLIGCIIKPKLGLDVTKHTQVAREVFLGGVDFVKDDENLTNQVFNPFKKRVKEVMRMIRVNNFKEKIYAFNVTAETEKMCQRAKFIKKQGGNCAMIDFLTNGFAGLQTLRSQNLGLMIHCHRAMHAALDRSPDYGISMLVLAKLVRLAGVDSLHTGTVLGKMEGGSEEVKVINEFLLSDWYGLKTVLPVASGGLHPGLVPDLVKILGKNILLNFGGGIHGHPRGSRAGAIAVLAAIEAEEQKIPLREAAKNHEELALALEYWEEGLI